MNLTGTIVKATGGYYYVQTERGEMECRARGIFRQEKRTPYVGDRVEVVENDDGSGGTVVEILPRKNHLIRPPIANIDYMVAVLSVTDPKPNLAVTDTFLAVLEHKEIEPIIAVTKTDLEDVRDLVALYSGAGYRVFPVCNETGEGVEPLRQTLKNGISAFSGNSGVGKSSLLNTIDPRFSLEVGDTSKKLGRGRHTTRHVEMYRLPQGGFAVDTPGFSSLDLMQMAADMKKEDLAQCFREFRPYLDQCRFRDCSHTKERGCAVLEALEKGAIAPTRHRSYIMMYDELKGRKEWEQRS